jgi:UDP-glucuronate 4-epimerase
MSKIIITGCAGFIGMHVTLDLLSKGYAVVGVDNLNDYYDPALKKARLFQIENQAHFEFFERDIANYNSLKEIFDRVQPHYVIHLAAQAGVRYSIQNPHVYFQSNLLGFGNILECSRHAKVKHLIYASSSSVYGANTELPYAVTQNVDHPVSLYAATKKSNELMAHSYSHLYQLPTTGLRYFTVYGPWGRPDMAPWLFTEAILADKPIKVFNHGKMRRDFTYIDDIVFATVALLELSPGVCSNQVSLMPDMPKTPYRVCNIGHHQPVELLKFIELLEHNLGQEAKKILLPIQDGDVLETYADISELQQLIQFPPLVSLEDGLSRWVAWYKSYARKT